jgi:hypothetical protein
MDQVYEAESLSMKWCHDCHRAPENFLRPTSEVFHPDWHAASPGAQRELGLKFKHDWNVNPPLNCGGCHR